MFEALKRVDLHGLRLRNVAITSSTLYLPRSVEVVTLKDIDHFTSLKLPTSPALREVHCELDKYPTEHQLLHLFLRATGKSLTTIGIYLLPDVDFAVAGIPPLSQLRHDISSAKELKVMAGNFRAIYCLYPFLPEQIEVLYIDLEYLAPPEYPDPARTDETGRFETREEHHPGGLHVILDVSEGQERGATVLDDPQRQILQLAKWVDNKQDQLKKLQHLIVRGGVQRYFEHYEDARVLMDACDDNKVKLYYECRLVARHGVVQGETLFPAISKEHDNYGLVT